MHGACIKIIKIKVICFNKIENVCRTKHLKRSWNHRGIRNFAKQGSHTNKVPLETKVTMNSLTYSCKVSFHFVTSQVLLRRETGGND